MSNERWPNNYRLNLFQRAIWYVILTIFGIIPIHLFTIWVFFNCQLNDFTNVNHPVWLSFMKTSPIAKCMWNGMLFLSFGFIHSLLAQKFMHKMMEEVFPPQTIRAIYVCWTGIPLFCLVMFWQPFDTIVWKVEIVSPFVTKVISFIPYSYFHYRFMRVVSRFGVFDFVGYAQLSKPAQAINRTEGMPQLITDGIYGWVRHPIYTFTVAAFLITPEMSLDRLYLTFMMLFYLYFGVPIEERKLISEFGQAYEKYRERVPAIFPSVSKIFGLTQMKSNESKTN